MAGESVKGLSWQVSLDGGSTYETAVANLKAITLPNGKSRDTVDLSTLTQAGIDRVIRALGLRNPGTMEFTLLGGDMSVYNTYENTYAKRTPANNILYWKLTFPLFDGEATAGNIVMQGDIAEGPNLNDFSIDKVGPVEFSVGIALSGAIVVTSGSA